ncbi:hypothetical protein [Paraburkholderia sp.]|uniref:hypothetical protein n=1 Tax=Paraburkholderia sp. TaxID=1926495 RepID=UPI002D6AFAE9|nr:hypothetical protein [Paraburkholderia sp.]HZZ06301.1 hypothetical protein [Paraburkholderia sp.]
MADVIDMAQDFDALNLAQGLAAQKIKAAHTPRLRAEGYCLNADCEESFNNSAQLFCNPACEREHAALTTPYARR